MNPSLWKLTTIGDVAKLGSGSTPSRAKQSEYYDGGIIPWVKTGDLNNGLILKTDECITQKALDESSCRVYPAGTLLVAMYGGFKQIGRTGLLGRDAAINQALTSIDLDLTMACATYVQHWLNFKVDHWQRLAGSSRKDPNITKSEVAVFPLLLPPLSEQVAISNVLSQWDRGILQLTEVISVKLQFKHCVMERILIGTSRFRNFGDEWLSVRLSDVTEECNERNRGRMGLESVMAVTKADGIVPMRERTIGASIDRYLVVQKNCFAYNPMRINIGSIARSQGDKDVLVSPDYVVFRCKEESKDVPGLDPDFLDHFRRSKLWEKFVMATGNGSVRIRIYYAELSRLKLNLPLLAEQKKIARLLNVMDREIELLRKQLDLLKLQKKGLMQKLLTGQVRVKSPKGAK